MLTNEGFAELVSETSDVCTKGGITVDHEARVLATRSSRPATLYTVLTMFESLSDRFNGIFTKLRGKGRLNEADVDATLREVRLALLEADVNVTVAKSLLARIRERAVGEETSKSLTPGQQVIKIVHQELITTLGVEVARLNSSSTPPLTILMVGLQGSGKTTSAGKLALHLRNQGKYPMLVAADLQRPAAIDQLPLIRASVGADFPLLFDSGIRDGEGIIKALAKGADFVMLGRSLLYGLGANGEAGLAQIINLISNEISLAMAQLGCSDVSKLNQSSLLES